MQDIETFYILFWSSVHSIGVVFCVDLVDIFNKGR